jgi:hypothetical protein
MNDDVVLFSIIFNFIKLLVPLHFDEGIKYS